MLRKIVVPFQTFLNLPDLPVLILPRSGGGGWSTAIIQGDLEWLRKSLNLVLIPECPIWAVKYVIFSVTLGHLNIMFPKITIFKSKNIRGGRKSTSKMKNTAKIQNLNKKAPTFEHFDLQKTHQNFFWSKVDTFSFLEVCLA